VLKDFLLQKNT